MGSPYSKRRKEALRKNQNVPIQSKQKYLQTNMDDTNGNMESEKAERPGFNERQKELVLESWRVIQEDIAKVGVQMFMK